MTAAQNSAPMGAVVMPHAASVTEMQQLLADLRTTFKSEAASVPVLYLNADHWAMVGALGCLLKRIDDLTARVDVMERQP